ncbi:MAG: YdcF family protein [Haliea sp.]
METLLFIISKLVAAAIKVETWLLLGMLLALLGLLTGRLLLAQLCLVATLLVTLVLGVFPLGGLLLQPLESRYPANPALTRVDGIVILGGGEDGSKSRFWGQVQLREGGERYTAALALAHRYPEAQLVFTGGSGRLRDLATEIDSEGSVAQAFFAAQGLDEQRLLLELRSRNTAENAALSLAVAQPQPGQTWVLVTSAFHMARAMHEFHQAGWPEMRPYPVDYRSGRFVDGIGWDLAENLRVLNTALHERVGLLVSGAP